MPREPRQTPHPTARGTASGGGITATLAALVVGLAGVVVCLMAVELAIRWVPALLPAGIYGSGRRHPLLDMNVHGGRLLYNKVRRVERTPNREGFLDVEHERAKPEGVLRIGFFGDSYVESAQVPLETVFYRQLADRLGPGVETLGFGISGWGTVNALRAFRTFTPLYELDAAIYVFVENDLGDQFLDLERAIGSKDSSRPFARLDEAAPDGWSEGWVRQPPTHSLWWNVGKLFQRHSLLAHVIEDRLTLLRAHGLQIRAKQEAVAMTRAAGAVPLSTDLPGTWPRKWAEPAQELGRRVLATWAREAREARVLLAVLYVPRSEPQLLGEIPLEDTWKPWLERTCAELGLPVIDPSEAFRTALAAGTPVYDDHWTPAGHALLAELLETIVRQWRACSWDPTPPWCHPETAAASGCYGTTAMAQAVFEGLPEDCSDGAPGSLAVPSSTLAPPSGQETP